MKLLLFFLIAIAGSFGFYHLAQFPGTLHIDWLGYELKVSILAALIGTLVFLILFWFILSLIYGVKSYFRGFALRRKIREIEEMQTTFLKGLNALELKDDKGLEQLLKKRPLPFPFKTYLQAGCALLRDEKETASRHLSTLLECAPLSGSTALMLAISLEKQGRIEEIGFLIEKIIHQKHIPSQGLRPIYEMALRHGYFKASKELLSKMNGDLNRDEKKQLEALYYFYTSTKTSDASEEMRLLEKAFDLYAENIKITAAYLSALLKMGDTKKVLKKLKALWATHKSTELREIAFKALESLSMLEQTETAENLVEQAPSDMQSLLLLGNVALRNNLYGKTEAVLQPLLDHYPCAETFDLKKRYHEALTKRTDLDEMSPLS